jgi:putative peptidoglycan lipid II flippase
MATKHQIFRSSMVVGFFSLLGGLTGILVETSIAANLGLSRSSDTFYLAFTVPYIITNLITATGQFSLVPFFSALEARHTSDELWRGFSYAVSVVLLGLGGIAALGAAGTPWLIRGLAPGFTLPQVELASHLCRWLFLIIISAGVAEIFRSFLLSQHRFALPSAAGFLRNVTVIVSILLTFSRYREYSIVLGYLAGYLLQFVVLGAQILVSFPARYSLTLRGSGEAFRNLRGAGTVQVASAMGWQAVVVVERIIASFLPPGTLTALNYGFKIMTTLAELLAGSVGTVALPALSRAVARRVRDEERKIFRDTLEISLALVTPVAVFCLLLDRNIIQLIFERGNFTAEATRLMSMVFFYYSLSLLAFAFIRILTFYLFARTEVSTYFRLAVFQYGLNLALDLLYVGILGLGAKGIPLACLTSLLVTSALALHRNIAELRSAVDRSLVIFATKDFLGAGVAALAVWGMSIWVGPPTSAFRNFVYLCALCSVGGLAFLATLAASRAVRISRIAADWRRPEEP